MHRHGIQRTFLCRILFLATVDCLLLCISELRAQSNGLDLTAYGRWYVSQGKDDCMASSWRQIGPVGRLPKGTSSRGQGQVHDIVLSPHYSQDSILFLASVYGGVWQKRGQGPWRPTSTDTALPQASVSSIAIHPLQPHLLFITTGDGESPLGRHAVVIDNQSPTRMTPLFSTGVYRSTDGGQSWQWLHTSDDPLVHALSGGGFLRVVRIHPLRPHRLWVVGTTGVWVAEDATSPTVRWRRVSSSLKTLDDDQSLKGIAFHPTDPQTVYVGGRHIYRSVDGGKTWDILPDIGESDGGFGNDFTIERINLATTPAAPDKLYAYCIGMRGQAPAYVVGIWDGRRWKVVDKRATVSPFEGIAVTRAAIAVSPTSADTLFWGTAIVRGGNVSRPRRYSPYSGAGYHADVHALAFTPDGRYLLAGTDGGVHILDLHTPGARWKDISDGLALKMGYRFGQSERRRDGIIVGWQDTGTDVYVDGQWTNIVGGDGFLGGVDLASGLAFGGSNASNYRLFSYDFSRKKVRVEGSARCLPVDPVEHQPTLIKSTRMRSHPRTGHLWMGMTELYERKKRGPATTKDRAKALWIRRSDIGRYIPQSWKRQLTEFDICPAAPQYIYLVINGYQNDADDGFAIQPELFLSTHGGCDGRSSTYRDTCFLRITPRLYDSGIRLRHYTPLYLKDTIRMPPISAVCFAPDDPRKAWIAFTGREPGVRIWMTDDGGHTWRNADPEGSLFDIPINAILYIPGSDDGIYLGTDMGVFAKDRHMRRWKRLCGFPNVRVSELQYHACSGRVRALTFGRGLWEGIPVWTATDLSQGQYVVDTIELWEEDKVLVRDLYIPSGHTLLIRGNTDKPVTIYMPHDGRVVLEDGARLIASNVVWTNGCSSYWKGIHWRKTPGTIPPTISLYNNKFEHLEDH